MRYAHIVGWGKSLPARVLTNAELSLTVDTSDAWIRDRTGIGARRIASDTESTSTLSINAAMAALEVAGISPAQLDLIIVATATPDHAFPSTACIVQDALGAAKAGAFDLGAACSGFVYGMSMAADAIRAGSANTVLVIGAETLSKIVNWKDRNTCVLFGDGAGALVLQASDQPGGLLSSILRSDGSGGDLLIVPAGGSKKPSTPDTLANFDNTIQMNGREVYKFATRVVDKTVRELLARTGWTINQLDMLIPHQANIRIIEAASKSLGLPMEKIFTNLEHYGNTSAASIPIAITEAVESGRLRPNDKVVAIGFGAGLTWAACALTWGQPRPVSRAQHVVVRAKIGIGGVRSRVKRGIRQAGERVTDALDPLLKRGERQAAREITPAKLEPVRKVDVPVPLPAARPAAPERPKIEDGPLNGKH